MADEQNVVETWLFDTLSGDSALNSAAPGGFWPDVIPDIGITDGPVPLPAGSYHLQAATDLMMIGAHRIWSNQLWLVKVSAKVGDDATLSDAVSRVDTLLHRQSATIDEGVVFACVREGSFSQASEERGVWYRQRGGFYRVYARAAE